MSEIPLTNRRRGSAWTLEAVIYFILSVIGLIATAAFNVTAALENRDYLGDWLGSGPAVNSLGADLFIVAIAGSVFIVAEARRLKIRYFWLYILGSAVTAFAFTFPLFMCVRARTIKHNARNT